MSRSIKKLATVAAASCLLAGCAHPPPRSFVPLIAFNPNYCLPSVSLTEATPVNLGEVETPLNEVVFDETSPCVQQGDGTPAIYHVFRLPQAAEPYLITVRTEPVGPAYLVVTADILAADGTVARQVDAKGFSFHGISLSALLRSRPGEEYLVVKSDPSRVGFAFDQISEVSQLYATTTTTTYTGKNGKTSTFTSTGYTQNGASLNHNFVFSHNGSLHVTATAILPPK